MHVLRLTWAFVFLLIANGCIHFTGALTECPSNIWLRDNGSFYCEDCASRSCWRSEEDRAEYEAELERSCPGNLVNEPCACCKICGKVQGEICGGPWGCEGRCVREDANGNEFRCTVPENAFLSGATNETGICMPKVCVKNCSRQSEKRVCGTDGRWYRNKCALRKYNCFRDEHTNKVSSAGDNSICDNVCNEIQPPEHGDVVFTQGIRDGSVATFSCHSGYVLSGPTVLTCNGPVWNGTPPICHTYPCDNFQCGQGEKCIVKSDNTPGCVCKSFEECPREPTPVCGSDLKTYRSECHMSIMSCRNSTGIELLHDGACQDTTEATIDVEDTDPHISA